jgi:hypothetical protein
MLPWGTSSMKIRTLSGGLLASRAITSVTPLLIFFLLFGAQGSGDPDIDIGHGWLLVD